MNNFLSLMINMSFIYLLFFLCNCTCMLNKTCLCLCLCLFLQVCIWLLLKVPLCLTWIMWTHYWMGMVTSMCDVIWVNQPLLSSLSPGLHLNITEGSPLSDLDFVNTLLNGNGYFNVWCNMSKPAIVIFSFSRSTSEYYWRFPSVWPGFCEHIIEWEWLLQCVM